MAAKKTGGLGRNFEYILEDNMPIVVQSPRKSKKRTPNNNAKAENKKANYRQLIDDVIQSDERINKETTSVKDSENEKVNIITNSNIKRSNPKIEKVDISEKTGNIKIKENTLTLKSDKKPLFDSNSARREAVKKLRQKIYLTLRNDNMDETVISNDENEEIAQSKDFYSPFVKIIPEKTKKEGNNYAE